MKSRTWSLISLLCFLAAIAFWLWGNARERSSVPAPPAPGPASSHRLGTPAGVRTQLVTRPEHVRPPSGRNPQGLASSGSPSSARHIVDPVFPARLRNTPKPINDLMRSETAILLRNALIDTALGLDLVMPDHLRSQAESVGYLVQSRGPISSPAFRAGLARAGVSIVSYIPNNALLVRGTAAGATALAASPLVQAVLPFEPYYKLGSDLLTLAVRNEAMAEGTRLNVVAFPGEGDAVRAALVDVGAAIEAEGRTPFGPEFVVAAPLDALAVVAGVPGVQWVETHAERQVMNDLMRVQLGVAADTIATNNYLGLSGSNIWVNVNDTGVDAEHPDLEGRVFANAPLGLTDTNGHGTYVAGTIASSGESGTLGTNFFGSVSNATFRGMAPEANLYVQTVDLISGPLQTDSHLQETAARTNYTVLNRTNSPLISNNSWGYPRQYDYNAAAASYDAAVRDAVPELPGPQAMVYVFAAGNAGMGNDSGTGGEPGTITSPATAKNVITVGALDSPRFIYYEIVATNQVTNIVDDEFVVTNVLETNQVILGDTDSSTEVAPYSGRGNVGIGLEGDTGRFKPDVVAPGAFVVSSCSSNWVIDRMLTNAEVTILEGIELRADEGFTNTIRVPTNATRLILEAVPNRLSPTPFPAIPWYVRLGDFPTVGDYVNTNQAILTTNGTPALVAGDWYYVVSNPSDGTVHFNVRVAVELSLDLGGLRDTLTNLNDGVGPYYRFDYGTSASAAGVSGVMALIQEFLERELEDEPGHSPALLKALLINGARSLGPPYDFQVRNRINYQGWGQAYLPGALPSAITNSTEREKWPVRWVDQNPTNALITGQSHQYELTLPSGLTEADLRVTLVWTDPPGNPVASVKLVNDLDLVVSNCVTGELYAGNQIEASSDYVTASGTNNAPIFDVINNVENVYLRRPADTNYAVFVQARRVNVNAVTAHTNDIAQDYALVVSLASTNSFGFKQVTETNTLPVVVMDLTNGVPVIEQRAGANSPLVLYPQGSTNQWRFFVFTNTPNPNAPITNNGPYIAVGTFSPLNVSVPRTTYADIDLYMTRGDSGLLTLNPVSLTNALKSASRDIEELISLTNAADGEIFYIGVKAEDQMAAEFNLIALSSDEPFTSIDENGNHHLRGLPIVVAVPDGSPVRPEAGMTFAVGMYPIDVLRAVASVTDYHERPGDLLGNLSHRRVFAVLNNHNDGDGDPEGMVGGLYDDSGSGEFPDSISTDGPGSLNDFMGVKGSGLWVLTTIDNAPAHTGWVENLEIRLSPAPDLLLGVAGTIAAMGWTNYFIDIPADATSMRVVVTNLTGPLNLYVRHEAMPTFTEYDQAAFLSPSGGELELTVDDIPPLTAGRYYIGLFNPSAVSVSYFLRVILERDPTRAYRKEYTTTNYVVLGDDVLTISTNEVDESRIVTGVKVGVRIDHLRASDLAIYLVSPQGEKVLIEENRGGTDRTQYGYETLTTNFHHVALTYSTNTGVAALYLDGALEVERDLGSFALQTDHDLFLGWKASTNTPTQYLGGLDEVDLYRRVLASSEILGIYKFGGAGKPTNDLVSRWSFDGDGQDGMTNNPASVLGPQFVAGRFDRGLQFAAGNRVQITNSPTLNVGAGAGFTLDAWINPLDLSVERPIAVWSDGTNAAGVELYIRPGPYTNVAPGQLAARLIGVDGVTNEIVSPYQGSIRTNATITNIVYITFTDDTNLAFVPIKFGDPATNGLPSATNILISGFEPVFVPPLTNLDTQAVFDGWTVDQNTATVLNSTVAHTGTNLLVLSNAWISASLPTEAGRIYQLQFAQRQQPQPADPISWWPGDRNALDAAAMNPGSEVGQVDYFQGLVRNAFAFQNNLGSVRVEPDASLDLTNEITLELWLWPASIPAGDGGLVGKGWATTPSIPVNYALSVSTRGIELWFNDPNAQSPESDDQTGLGRELVNLPVVLQPGIWYHLAATLRQISHTQVEMSLYLDGELRRSKVLPGRLADALSADPLLLGTLNAVDTGFDGLLDEVELYRRVLTATEIAEIHAMNAAGKSPLPGPVLSRVVIDNASSNTFNASSVWATNRYVFMASTNGTPLSLQALDRGLLVDSVELQELATTYFLPEEDMESLIGLSAVGNWRLEVVDRRTGLTNGLDSALISWALELTYAPLRLPAVTLTNGIPYTNTVATGAARYFLVDVPRSATRATNSFRSDLGLDLWFNQNAAPRFDLLNGDLLLLTNATDGIAVVGTNGTWLADTNGVALNPIQPVPVLRPGYRYYLALTNTGPLQTFIIQVDFDALDTNVYGVTPLDFGQTLTTNITTTNGMHYYRYVVTTNATSASFEVVPTNGNVQLYIRRAESVPDPLPTPRAYDYASENAGTNAEIILVTQDSLVPLGSGPWYLGVLNVETNTVDYTVRVVEYTGTTPGATRLFEGIPVAGSAPVASPQQFVFTVADGAPAAQFDLYDLSGPATLYLQHGRQPTLDDYWVFDSGTPTAPAKLIVRTNDSLLELGGTWYLAVVKDAATASSDVAFVVRAGYPPDPTPVVALASAVSVSSTLAADTFGAPRGPDYFRFTVADLATNLVMSVVPVDGNADVFLRYGLPLPSDSSFDYAGWNSDVNPEWIVVSPDTTPVPLAPGDWYLAVFNQTLSSVTYQVQVTQILAGGSPVPIPVIPSVSASPSGMTIEWAAPPGVDFELEYALEIPAEGPVLWQKTSVILNSATGSYRFVDDGSLTGGPSAVKFLRLVQVQP